MAAMMEANKKKELRMRMPPAPEIADAWNAYFEDKWEKKGVVRDSHARYALSAFEYIQSAEKTEEKPLLAVDDMSAALKVLGLRAINRELGSKPQRLDLSYVKLADGLYQKLREDTVEDETRRNAIYNYMQILCFSWHTQDALEMVRRDGVRATRGRISSIISGFTGERNVAALRSVVDLLENDHPGLLEECAAPLTNAFAIMDEMQDAKRVYSKVKLTQHEDFYTTVLTAAIRNNEIEWGRSIVQKLLDADDILTKQRRHWDVTFVWAAGTGKSVDEVDRMMQLMVQRNPDFTPDTKTMNKLIQYAVTKNDAYLAERFLSLGAKWGAEPDALTYLLQMDYRLSNGDIDGAISAYHNLQDWDLPAQEDIPRMNRLVQAMCASGKHSFESIMSVVDVLNRRRAPFETDTTAALSILHLKRDEFYDVADLLRTQVGNYDTTERIRIRDTLFNFCLDRRNSVARIWDTYVIFQQIFDAETDRPIRTAIMNEFLARRRSDMAVHVFNHMRESTRDDTRATLDTYVDIFVGISRLADDESLEVVHNQMKLDMNIEPNTRLQNACMLAFMGCNMPRHAYMFWRDIIASAEGPSYNSLLIVMKVCERMPFGEEEARTIWQKIRTLDVEITPELLGAYVGALAGNDLIENAMVVVERAEKEYGIVPDAVM